MTSTKVSEVTKGIGSLAISESKKGTDKSQETQQQEEEKEIETSAEAAGECKRILSSLMRKLVLIAENHEAREATKEAEREAREAAAGKESKDPSGAKKNPGGLGFGIGDVFTSLATGKMETLFSEKLTLKQKLIFGEKFTDAGDAVVITEGFIWGSKNYWDHIEKKNESFFLKNINIFALPKAGASMIKDIWEAKDFLSSANKRMVFEHLDEMIYYSRMFEEIREEEGLSPLPVAEEGEEDEEDEEEVDV